MAIKNELPIITKKKKIDLKKLVLLAKKVRKSLEEEERYLEKHSKDENSISGRILLGS